VGGAGNCLLLLVLLLDWLVHLLRLLLLASSATTTSSAWFSSSPKILLLLLLEPWFVGSALHCAYFLRMLLILGVFPFAVLLFPGDEDSSPQLLNRRDVPYRINLGMNLRQVVVFCWDFGQEKEGL
jgi:hypothetical protein